MKIKRYIKFAVLICILTTAFSFITESTKANLPGINLVDVKNSEYVVKKILNTENGMPANGVSTVIQDSRGYIWAATFNGLVRYDGSRISVYNTGNVPRLETNRFVEVVECPNGDIWAGLEYSSVVQISQDTSRVYQISEDLADLNTYITRIFFDDEDNIWIGTNSGLFILENGNFQRVDGLPDQIIQKIIQDGDRLVVLMEYGMYHLHPGSGEIKMILELDGADILYKSNYRVEDFSQVERFWDVILVDDYKLVVHENGILQMDENNYKILLKREEIGQSILHGLRRHNGQYYVYAAEGLFRIDDLFSDEKEAVRYSSQRVNDMIFDHEESIWISTSASGLVQFVETPVYQGEKFQAVSDVPITAIMEDSSENLWIGTNCDGLYRFNEESVSRFGTQQGIENICVWSLMEQSNGTIWAGTWGAGVFYLEPEENMFRRFVPEIMEDAHAVLSIFEDSEGRIWFGTFGKGLYRYDGEETVLIKNESGGNVSAVRMMFEDESGTLLFASDGGIGFYDNNVLVKPEEFNQLDTRNYRTIRKDHEGRFWFGSYGGGLFFLDTDGSPRTITTENGLYDNTISQIQFDRRGNLWLAGNLGVFFIEREELDRFYQREIQELRVSRIGVKEGLPIRETTGGFMPSDHLNLQGELFIPTVQGLAVLDTERMHLNRNKPNVHIERVELDGNTFRPDDIKKIPHVTQRLIFHFTALSFKNPDYVRFQYKLEGLDTQWREGGSDREAIYTTLPPGEYTLLVRASNNDGFWNNEGTSYAFIVPPPFWQTTWFYLAVVLLLGALVYGGYYFRLRNIHRNNLILRTEVENRTEELKASNQELKQLIEEKNKLHRILAHDLRNPFTSILGYIDLLKLRFDDEGDDENKEIMEMLYNSGRSTLNLLENLLSWSGVNSGGLKPDIEPVNIQDLIEEAKNMIEAQASFKSIEVMSNVNEKITILADRNMITTVLRNLISNAIKFSGIGSKVEVYLKENTDEVIVTVSDSGVGIDMDDVNDLFNPEMITQKLGTTGETGVGMGLPLCKEFLDLHGGKIWAESEPGVGSKFNFTLKKAHQK